MKEGSEMMARHALLTDLNRTRDLTGSRRRISVTSSSGSSAGRGSFVLFVLLLLRAFKSMAEYMQARDRAHEV